MQSLLPGIRLPAPPGLYACDTGEGIGKAQNGVMTATAVYTVRGAELTITPLNAKEASNGNEPTAGKIPQDVGRAYIKAGNVLYCAKNDGTVSAVDVTDMESPSVAWQGSIEGKAWTMLAADERLFVVNDAGSIFCFGPRQSKVVKHAIDRQPPLPSGNSNSHASDGVPRTTLTKAFKGVELTDDKVIIQLRAHEGATIISGVELLLEA